MTNYCLSIGFATRQLAEDYTHELENLAHPSLQALSIFECAPNGLRWQIDAYYPTVDDATRSATVAISYGIALDDLAISAVEQTNWVRQSLDSLQPVQVGRFFIHGSHHRMRKPANAIGLEIEAGTAFGTGHHGTTRGCLLALQHLLRSWKPHRIVDVGCGSGILAIAAARATRRAVVAGDIDPEAVRVTRINARKNCVNLKVMRADGVDHRAIKINGPYDLVMANILASPLAAVASDFAHIVGDHGYLILSGLLWGQRQWIERVYRQFGFVPLLRLQVEGWATLVLCRRSMAKCPSHSRWALSSNRHGYTLGNHRLFDPQTRQRMSLRATPMSSRTRSSKAWS